MNDLGFLALLLVLAGSVLLWWAQSSQIEYYRRDHDRLRDELADLHLRHNRDDNLQDQ